MTSEEQIKGLYNLKEYLVENPIELEGYTSLPITLIDYAIEALEREVSREVFEQVVRERDIAIEQLNELGYEFGEKIEPKYCDRNICIKNEYNSIGCEDCEVTKSQEPKTGHWEYGYAFPDGNYCKCSECKEMIKCIYPMRYCPNCGNRKVEPQEG